MCLNSRRVHGKISLSGAPLWAPMGMPFAERVDLGD